GPLMPPRNSAGLEKAGARNGAAISAMSRNFLRYGLDSHGNEPVCRAFPAISGPEWRWFVSIIAQMAWSNPSRCTRLWEGRRMTDAENKGAPAVAELALAPKKMTEISCSRGLHSFMERNRLSFGFTSYQSGRLYLVGRMPRGRVSFHERHFVRAMGVAATPQRLYLAGQHQIWRLENVLSPGQTMDGFDRNYVPRNAQTTGDLDVHELGADRNGRVIFVN